MGIARRSRTEGSKHTPERRPPRPRARTPTSCDRSSRTRPPAGSAPRARTRGSRAGKAPPSAGSRPHAWKKVDASASTRGGMEGPSGRMNPSLGRKQVGATATTKVGRRFGRIPPDRGPSSAARRNPPSHPRQHGIFLIHSVSLCFLFRASRHPSNPPTRTSLGNHYIKPCPFGSQDRLSSRDWNKIHPEPGDPTIARIGTDDHCMNGRIEAAFDG